MDIAQHLSDLPNFIHVYYGAFIWAIGIGLCWRAARAWLSDYRRAERIAGYQTRKGF